MIKPRYRQLTPVQRYQIQALLEAGNSQAAIARQLQCHPSTISRELARCPGPRYQACLAQAASDTRRRSACKATKLNAITLNTIKRCLKRYFSPEMVANRMALEAGKRVLSTTTIYRWIAQDWQNGGTMHRHLQRAYRPYRTRYGVLDRRKRLGQRRSIHERPKVVETRSRRGDLGRRYDVWQRRPPGDLGGSMFEVLHGSEDTQANQAAHRGSNHGHVA